MIGTFFRRLHGVAATQPNYIYLCPLPREHGTSDADTYIDVQTQARRQMHTCSHAPPTELKPHTGAYIHRQIRFSNCQHCKTKSMCSPKTSVRQ